MTVEENYIDYIKNVLHPVEYSRRDKEISVLWKDKNGNYFIESSERKLLRRLKIDKKNYCVCEIWESTGTRGRLWRHYFDR